MAQSGVPLPTSSAWTRVICCNPSLIGNASQFINLWRYRDQALATLGNATLTFTNDIDLFADPLNGGRPNLGFLVGGVSLFNLLIGPNICDGQWHVLVVTCSADGKTITGYTDGVLGASNTGATDTRFTVPADYIDVCEGP